MPRELYEELLSGRGELKELVDAARELRTWREGSLAEQEFQDGLWVEEDPMAQAQRTESWSMAAQDSERSLPAEYSGGERMIVVARDASGELYMELVEGDPLLVNGRWMRQGERVSITAIPTLITGIDADGTAHRLQ